jgi:hypothetical protein
MGDKISKKGYKPSLFQVVGIENVVWYKLIKI